MLIRLASLAGLTLLWPGLHLALFWARFGRLPPDGATGALVFAPMGLVAAVHLVWLLARARTRRQKVAASLGYLAACPFALVASLLGGLLFAGFLGAALGAVPLIAGASTGYLLGRDRTASTP